MKFLNRVLPNGLAVVGEVNKAAQSAAVGFFVKTGARDETAQINGVSHFLEHMLFKGTEDLSALEVNEAFDRTGAKFNAFTSEENTVFYAAVLPEYLLEVTELWTKLMRPTLRTEDFEIEKNVIKEEIAMYQDHPQFDVIDRCRNIHFKDHPCGHSVLGTNESITDLTAEQMRQYFNDRYAPNNMMLACSGNFDFDSICAIAEEKCGQWQKLPMERKIEFSPGSMETQYIEKPNLVCEHICLISSTVSYQDKRKYAAGLLTVITGDDSGSRYFWQLVDTAIAETAVMQYEPMDGIGALYTYLRCSPENADKAIGIVKKIFDDLSKDGIRPAEVQMAKNKILSAIKIKNELQTGRLVDLGFNWIYLKEYLSNEDDIAAVQAITIEDVNTII